MSGIVNEQAQSNMFRAQDMVTQRAEKKNALLNQTRPPGSVTKTHLAYRPDHISDPALRRQAQANSIAREPKLWTIQESVESEAR